MINMPLLIWNRGNHLIIFCICIERNSKTTILYIIKWQPRHPRNWTIKHWKIIVLYVLNACWLSLSNSLVICCQCIGVNYPRCPPRVFRSVQAEMQKWNQVIHRVIHRFAFLYSYQNLTTNDKRDKGEGMLPTTNSFWNVESRQFLGWCLVSGIESELKQGLIKCSVWLYV